MTNSGPVAQGADALHETLLMERSSADERSKKTESQKLKPLSSPWPGRRAPALPEHSLAKTLLGFVWSLSAWDQVYLCALSIAVATLDVVPIEIQRRIINVTVNRDKIGTILFLALAYGALVIIQGSVKLLLNIYRSWVAESAVRALRSLINNLYHGNGFQPASPAARGLEIAMILTECEPVGGFVGDSISQPLL
jgi:hypothetical protein